MEFLQSFINEANNLLWSYIIIGLLLGLGLYFTIRLRFMQIVKIRELVHVLKDKNDGIAGENTISSLQAFFIGAATRIGTGNVAGVAMAIAVGGPGAVFWMWVVAILGGASAFVESTLAQIYKVKDPEGGFKGGPAYYMRKQLGSKTLSTIFAVGIVISFGLTFNAVQSNTIAASFTSSFNVNASVVGIALVALTAIIIFGGVQRVAKFSSFIVPIMAGFYVLLAAYVVLTNLSDMPAVFALIFKNAFGIDQVVGGGMGAAIMMGVKRGLFSNEAGMGSAPNAAATAVVSHPAKQGFVQALGVFFDTLVVCSATAFIILLSDSYTTGLQGVELTQASLAEHFGGWAGIFLSFAIFMFAFSTIIGSYYYGEANIPFIHKSKAALYIYRVLALGAVMAGSVASLQIVWDFADLAMAIMALTNLIAIALLGKIAFKAFDHYMEQRKQGVDPVFYADDIDGLKGVESWPVREAKQFKKAN